MATYRSRLGLPCRLRRADLEPGLDGDKAEALRVVTGAAWALFVVDYVVQLALAPRRGRFFVHNLFDLLVVALPLLRPLRSRGCSRCCTC